MENHGEITYYARLSIDQPWKEKIKHSVDFKISNPVNLNFWVTSLDDPIEMETSKKFCCGLSKPLYMRASIPWQGFTPGQLIKVGVDVKNQSNLEIKGIRVCLMKIVQYKHLENKLNTKENVTMEAEVSSAAGVDKYKSQSMEIVLEVPQIKSTLSEFCKIIFINYELHVFADISGGQKTPDLILPIIVGDNSLASTERRLRIGPAVLSVQNL